MYKSFSKGIFVLCFFLTALVALSAPTVELTAQEQAWLTEHGGTIRVACHGNYMPVSFVSQSGRADGIMPDLFRWIAERNGFNVEFIPATRKQSEENILSGKYDVAVSATENNDDARLLYTADVMELPVFLFVPSKNWTKILPSGLRIAYDSNPSPLDRMKVSYQKVPCNTLSETVDAVRSGRADALLCSEPVFLYYCYTQNLTDEFKKVGPALQTSHLCMVVAPSNAPLYTLLSKSLEKARSEGVIRWIGREWVGGAYTKIGARILHYSFYVVLGFGLLLAALLLFWLWDIRLSRRVVEKTRQLRNSEERLRTIFQNSPDAILIEDDHGTVLDANPVACAFHGLSHGEMIGRNAFDMVSAACRNEVERDFNKWFTGELKRHETLLQSSDGREVPVEVIGAPMRFEGKNAVLLLVRDMTQRKHVEQALEESEMRYRGLVEAQSNFIVRIDTGGLFTFVNEAFCRFVGRSRGELVGTDCRSFIYYDDLAIPNQTIETLVSRRERAVTVEHRMRARTRTAWVQWENIAVFDESGRVVEIQSVGQDITERRRIYEALQESEKRLRFLFEEIPHVAVQGYNTAREVIFWNHASEELYKYSKKDVLGRKMEDIVLTTDRREEMVAAFDNWVKTGVPIPSGEVLKSTADGRQVAVYSSRLATRNHHGEWELYVIDVDLSELKRASEEIVKAKEAAERASRAKSEFLANMSHEIRTPMNGVMGMTHLLLETQLTADQRDSVQTIMESTQELMRIIDELLDISRIEAGEVRLHPEPFCMRETVEKVVFLFADRAGKKGVDISIAIHDSVPKQMLGDSGRIRQVLINLVGNALKFTHDGHIQIRMQAERAEDGWNLLADVKDTGIGMTSELQERIFEKFTQGDTSSKRQYGGTGLGLAITRQLVRLMGGEISVSSEVNKGSAFRFNLKLGSAEANEPVPAPVTPASNEEKKISGNILLVEDNLVNQKVAAAMIKKMGCTVTVVPNGARALEQIALRKFDLIFMDCQMPIMDGFEATLAIRQMVGEIRDIPIVAMTAHALKEDRQHCLDAGMNDYLSKPVHIDALVAVLQKYCG